MVFTPRKVYLKPAAFWKPEWQNKTKKMSFSETLILKRAPASLCEPVKTVQNLHARVLVEFTIFA